jgi:hypothetical protein
LPIQQHELRKLRIMLLLVASTDFGRYRNLDLAGAGPDHVRATMQLLTAFDPWKLFCRTTELLEVDQHDGPSPMQKSAAKSLRTATASGIPQRAPGLASTALAPLLLRLLPC